MAFGIASMAFSTIGIGLDRNAPALVHAERGDIHLALQIALDPVVVLREFGFGEFECLASAGKSWNSFICLVRRPALGQLRVVLAEVVLGEIEERELADQFGLELVQLGRFVLLVGRRCRRRRKPCGRYRSS